MKRAKLTEANVRTIHRLRGLVRPTLLAARYSVARSTIYSVWSGRNWRRLHPEGSELPRPSVTRETPSCDLGIFANSIRSCLGLSPIRYRVGSP